MRKPKVVFLVMTQMVTQRNPVSDLRIRKALKSRWRRWVRFKERGDNIAAAISEVTKTMMQQQIGGIVVFRQSVDGRLTPGYTKIFQAKWGHDGLPFIRFDGPGGNFWRLRLSQSHPKLIRNLARLARG